MLKVNLQLFAHSAAVLSNGRDSQAKRVQVLNVPDFDTCSVVAHEMSTWNKIIQVKRR